MLEFIWRSLVRMSDILIIGGGVIGMLTAYELTLAGCQVTLIDKKQLGGESSWAGGGIISPLYPWRYDDAVSALAQWGQDYYPELTEKIEAATGLQAELIQSGLLILDSVEATDALKWAKSWQSNLQVIEKTKIFKIEENLAASRVPDDQAIWMPEVRQVRNPRLVKVLKEYLIQKGVRIIEGQEVSNFLVTNNVVGGVTTSSGDIYADNVLVTGGAWSANLLKKIKFSINVKPVKGQMIIYKAISGLVNNIVLSKDRYIIPRQDGRILVGSTLEYTDFDKSTTVEAKEALIAEAISIIPALSRFEIEHHWAGLRPGSENGIPYICEHPEISGLFINTGHFRNGIVLGPASARLMADIILKRPPIVDAAPYQCKC